MPISLLYPEQLPPLLEIDSDIIYHLSLDLVFARICSDRAKCEFFLRTLARVPSDHLIIEYRQAIIRDFRDHPEMLEKLLELFSQFSELIIFHKQNNKDSFRLQVEGTGSATSHKNLLQMRARNLLRSLNLIRGVADILLSDDLRSDGLHRLGDVCNKFTHGEAYTRLLNMCRKYSNYSVAGFTDCKLVVNDEGEISNCELIDHRHVRITDSALGQSRFLRFRRDTKDIYPCAQIACVESDYYKKYIEMSLADLSSLFSSLCSQLFECFGGLREELDFYFIALEYINFLETRSVQYCYPTLTNGALRVEKLYDLLLLTANESGDVVGNSLCVEDTPGVVILGENSSGKTVFLRSVGCAFVLAQAGIPIAASFAQIPISAKFVSQFAEAEKEFCVNDESGRFEQEVKTLSDIVASAEPGDCVLLNEPFQSTSYTEGADVLYSVLQYFSTIGVRWFLVTHLRELEIKFIENDVVVLYAMPGYKFASVPPK